MRKPISQKLLELYDEGGQAAVMDWVLKTHPEWPWTWCEPCDVEAPVWGGYCAVCFSRKPYEREEV